MNSSSRNSQYRNHHQYNEYLINKYSYSLFNFCLLYAKILTEKTFLKKFMFFDGSSQEFRRLNDKMINLKKRAKKVLLEYLSKRYEFGKLDNGYFLYHEELSGFFRFLDKEIESNKMLLSSKTFGPQQIKGVHRYPETMVALLFSILMNNKISTTNKQRIKLIDKYKNSFTSLPKFMPEILDKKCNEFLVDFFVKIGMKDLNPNLDDVFELMNWLNNKTSYLSRLKYREKESLSERVRKTLSGKFFDKEFAGILLFDLFEFFTQSYFENGQLKDKASMLKKAMTVREAFPIISLKFEKDMIQIGELVKKDVSSYYFVQKSYPIDGKGNKPSENKLPFKGDTISLKIKFLADSFEYKTITV